MNAAQFLKKRMICPHRGAVEQSVRSCMYAHWLANQQEHLWSTCGMTGLDLINILDQCRSCETGKAYLMRYKKRFGLEFYMPMTAPANRAIMNEAKSFEAHTQPMTMQATRARWGYPNFWIDEEQYGRY